MRTVFYYLPAQEPEAGSSSDEETESPDPKRQKIRDDAMFDAYHEHRANIGSQKLGRQLKNAFGVHHAELEDDLPFGHNFIDNS